MPVGRTAATGPHVLRQMNVAAVLSALREAGTAGVSGLASSTGLSRPAVTRALAGLRDRGLVEFTAAGGTQQHGRPAQYARFRAEAGHIAGIDIGARKVLVMIADLAGQVLTTRRATVRAGAAGPEVFDTVRSALTDAAAEAGVRLSGLWAVSVGTPGIVDRSRGEVLLAPSIPGWAGLPVVPLLREWLHCPVSIDNDVNLAVLGERWQGVAADADSLVFVQWGRRIGTGIIINGMPYRGSSGAAGELGFIDLTTGLDSTPRSRPADGTGPFERLVGAAAIRGLALRAGAPAGSGEDDIAPLFEAAAAGDRAAAEVVELVAARFARGLSALLLLLDPGRVVIGGGVTRAGDTLLEPVRRHLALHTLTPVQVSASTLGERAVAIGAVRHALDVAEERMMTPPAG
ncbi:ROK family transcriptional regulator [Streptomyces beijiangensis]|uniref:ROK family transcriptional regulator n=1 Tax=Streptomyces beijiangensis TaxID=163361 RepID=A0A939FBZ6_9ACTN|nr:ROK family transcriptional regulator [Streptomyces beijiangensis]MBO0515426.1 ROK family transcriptional regulator [Streptomyces beijiangensis]